MLHSRADSTNTEYEKSSNSRIESRTIYPSVSNTIAYIKCVSTL